MSDAALSELDRRVLSRIQAGFPMEPRPYDVLARALGSSEQEVLASVRGMRAAGVIRRIGAIFDSARIGYRSTLCAIAAPRDRIDEVAAAISAYPNVTHNYEREDRYSVWFTVIAPTQERIDEILGEIAARTGIDDILDLPATRLFKIRVDFDLTGEREAAEAPKMTKPAEAEVVSMDEREKALARLLQEDLPDLEAPFEATAGQLRSQGADEDEAWVLGRTRAWTDAGVIRRFGAAIKHHKTGFTSNAMGVWDCPEAEIERVGAIMAGFAEVSHCYQRPRRATWPHDLYTMIHGRSHEECEDVAERIRVATGLPPARLLYSVREFKKASMRYFAEGPAHEGSTGMTHARSADDFAAAQQVIPGGVNSPVRAFKSVGGHPLFYDRAKGCRVWDVDGNEYVDFVASWGPMILGHAPDAVLDAVREQLAKGTSYGAPCEAEVRMAEAVVECVPSIEMVRMVSSGTEATMSAIRLARGFTGRDTFVKFDGNYHGHSDALLVAAGSGLVTLGIPSTPGVTKGAAQDTIVLPYNDLEAVAKVLEEQGAQIAAIIVEPVAGNMGVVPPRPGFLQGLRDLCDSHGVVLIFDEVITGFRVALGGAQELFGVTPDLTTLGKIIGGGFPVGAFGGKRQIMEALAPVGPVYQAGTLSGNPVAMVAGLALIEALRKPGVYEALESKGARLASGLCRAAEEAGVATCCTRVGSMACLFFTTEDVRDWSTASTADTARYSAYFRGMLDRGFLLAPSQYEATFVGLAHTDDDIDAAVEAARAVLKEV